MHQVQLYMGKIGSLCDEQLVSWWQFNYAEFLCQSNKFICQSDEFNAKVMNSIAKVTNSWQFQATNSITKATNSIAYYSSLTQ